MTQVSKRNLRRFLSVTKSAGQQQQHQQSSVCTRPVNYDISSSQTGFICSDRHIYFTCLCLAYFIKLDKQKKLFLFLSYLGQVQGVLVGHL